MDNVKTPLNQEFTDQITALWNGKVSKSLNPDLSVHLTDVNNSVDVPMMNPATGKIYEHQIPTTGEILLTIDRSVPTNYNCSIAIKALGDVTLFTQGQPPDIRQSNGELLNLMFTSETVPDRISGNFLEIWLRNYMPQNIPQIITDVQFSGLLSIQILKLFRLPMTEITIPAAPNMRALTIQRCNNLTTVNIDNVRNMQTLRFFACPNLTSFTLATGEDYFAEAWSSNLSLISVGFTKLNTPANLGMSISQYVAFWENILRPVSRNFPVFNTGIISGLNLSSGDKSTFNSSIGNYGWTAQ